MLCSGCGLVLKVNQCNGTDTDVFLFSIFLFVIPGGGTFIVILAANQTSLDLQTSERIRKSFAIKARAAASTLVTAGSITTTTTTLGIGGPTKKMGCRPAAKNRGSSAPPQRSPVPMSFLNRETPEYYQSPRGPNVQSLTSVDDTVTIAPPPPSPSAAANRPTSIPLSSHFNRPPPSLQQPSNCLTAPKPAFAPQIRHEIWRQRSMLNNPSEHVHVRRKWIKKRPKSAAAAGNRRSASRSVSRAVSRIRAASSHSNAVTNGIINVDEPEEFKSEEGQKV